MRISKIITTVLLAALCLPLSAQSEAGLLVGAEVEKRVNKKLSIGILSHGDRYLGMTAAMTQAPVPTAISDACPHDYSKNL